jgi:hypothetical protein
MHCSQLQLRAVHPAASNSDHMKSSQAMLAALELLLNSIFSSLKRIYSSTVRWHLQDKQLLTSVPSIKSSPLAIGHAIGDSTAMSPAVK